jgi:hypothetical protein
MTLGRVGLHANLALPKTSCPVCDAYQIPNLVSLATPLAATQAGLEACQSGLILKP